MNTQGSDEKKAGEVLRSAAPYMTLGLQMALAVTVFLFIGKYADELWGTTPWLMIIGIVFGFTGSMIKFFRMATEMGEKEDRERGSKV